MIVHVVESTATGTLSMLKNLVNEQVKLGEEVSVIFSRRPETPRDIREFFDESVDLHHVQMSGKWLFFCIFKIRAMICKLSPNVIFFHSSFAGFFGRLAILGLNFPSFYIPHCISLMRTDVGKLKRAAFMLLEWIGALKNSKYVACSESERSCIQKYIPFRECSLVENSVDDKYWVAGYNDWGARCSTIITVGQIRAQKNPEKFAEIAKKVRKIRNDVEFIWVGDGDEAQRSLLESAGVQVTGWKSSEEVKSLLLRSKVYLSTARWEGMPVSPIEAMLCGCVAVLSDCAGNRDIVRKDVSGYLFSEAEDASDMIMMVLSDFELGQRISSAGTLHCKGKYSVERYVKDMSCLIDGVMEGAVNV